MSGRREYPDPRPVEWPAGVSRPETLTEQIQRLVRIAVSQEAAAQGFETFEEADDFDVDDDGDLPLSPYELSAMQEERKMGRDASNLERPNRRVRDHGTEGEVEQSGVASGESVSKVRSDRVSEESGQGSVRERAGRAAEGRESRGGDS